ncbi:ABC transporter permease [Sporosarcina limicola]|uniref:ABC-2 type transport system permease protein n=1 Tax=Sporosarcina limicola TaxID=34101 RepID=A0A927MEN7_9BACL|nr:ABC transporter permease subunit [Sporosarcina limicola]MBE1553253.1 ABC-2 type transport system permease protein [Sporosarcina limicola]
MPKLIQNEWMKLWSKKGTWVMAILLVAIIIGFQGIAKLSEKYMDDSRWTETLQGDLAEVEKELASPDLTEDKKVELEERKSEMESNISFSIESSQPQTREKVITETFGIMSMVTLLTIIVASGIVSTEFSQGTIKMLLSRPVKRWKILTSKYITVLLFCLLATTITYVSSAIGAFIFFPASVENSFMFYGTELTTSAFLGKSLYMMFLAFINAAVISTLAFMLGTVFRSTSMANGVSIFLFFTGPVIVAFLSKYEIAKYVLFANANLTQYETGQTFFDDMTMPFSIAVLIGYVIIFLVLSLVSFTKRDVTA